ncbi:hypothetical protein ACQQ2N_08525 [Dokdonella sp. MW10]|uniref:hypothetical protein n=1 Tax=Dokdonella sp. MW10 TaxID=2992926 RepID=UPI003F820F04
MEKGARNVVPGQHARSPDPLSGKHALHRSLLFWAGLCSALASALHIACIVGGPAWYRALGAGEGMARMAANGDAYPAIVTSFVALVLAAWAAFAWSGAGLIRRLPLLRTALVAITMVYLLRGIAFVPLKARIPDNSEAFWLWSSAICFVIGMLHLAGLVQAWSSLKRTPSARRAA